MPTVIWEIDRQIRSDVDVATAVVRDVVKRLKRYEWLEKDVFSVHMALEEALMNAIKHGNQNDESKRIHLIIAIRENSLMARITDEGTGFDPMSVPDPCDETNLEKPCGRGVALIRNFVDDVRYNAVGNMIEFHKRKSD